MIHIIPVNDLKEHIETSACECQPRAIKENNELIIVHNSFDGREGLEWTEEILNNAQISTPNPEVSDTTKADSSNGVEK